MHYLLRHLVVYPGRRLVDCPRAVAMLLALSAALAVLLIIQDVMLAAALAVGAAVGFAARGLALRARVLLTDLWSAGIKVFYLAGALLYDLSVLLRALAVASRTARQLPPVPPAALPAAGVNLTPRLCPVPTLARA